MPQNLRTWEKREVLECEDMRRQRGLLGHVLQLYVVLGSRESALCDHLPGVVGRQEAEQNDEEHDKGLPVACSGIACSPS